MINKTLLIIILVTNLIFSSVGTALEVGITEGIESVLVTHNGKEVVIQRNQDQNNLINPEFTKTSRPCPPFCIRPINMTEGVETIVELEVLDYLQDENSVVIDARTIAWVEKGSIPGAINLPWDIFENDTESEIFKKLLEEIFTVTINDDEYYFNTAKTLVLFCNGSWCNQSSTSIRALLELGYPADKLKWFRGGMQAWESLGFTTVTDVLIPDISLNTKIIDLITLPSEETTFKTWLIWLKNLCFIWRDNVEVKITSEFKSVPIMHNDREVLIQRNQNKDNTINPIFAKTSRPCPPKCLKSTDSIAEVEIVAELEMLDYLERMSAGDNSILVIDSRAINWVVKGSIPGSVNIPWDIFSGKKSSPPIVRKILGELIGANIEDENKYSFENAKTLVIFCNGPWCNKSHDNVVTLLKLGYPAKKLKWYRGGMQAWESFGLTTVKDIPMPWFGL
jgi:rhodanese-related sulfurtransferase